MNAQHETTIRRTLAVLAMLAMITVAGCGSAATPDSTANVASPIVDASGASAPVALPDGSSPTTVPGGSAPGGTAPGDSAPGGTAPPPAPAPTTPPPPTTTTVPPPAAPVKVNLIQHGSWNFHTDADDGAGGSGEYHQSSGQSVKLRSWAWHGYNGSNGTTAQFVAKYDPAPTLADLGTELALVTVRLRAYGQGTLKAPWDRGARANISTQAGPSGAPLLPHFLLQLEISRSVEQDEPYPFRFDEVVEHQFYVTPDSPDVYVSLLASCAAFSGGQAFALLNEGYCDMYEAGNVNLEFIEATFSSIEWLEANGIDHPAPPQ